jgi:hypothetical protein
MQALMDPMPAELTTAYLTPPMPTVTYDKDTHTINITVIASLDPVNTNSLLLHPPVIAIPGSWGVPPFPTWNLLWELQPDDTLFSVDFDTEKGGVKVLTDLPNSDGVLSNVGLQLNGQWLITIENRLADGKPPLVLKYDIAAKGRRSCDQGPVSLVVHDPTIVIVQDPIGG